MLRRRLLLILGSLLGSLLLMAIVAIVLLQSILEDMRRIDTQVMVAVEDVNELSSKMALVRVELYMLGMQKTDHRSTLIELIGSIRNIAERLESQSLVQETNSRLMYRKIVDQLPAFEKQIKALVAARTPDTATLHNRKALMTSAALQQHLLDLGQMARNHTRQKQKDLIVRFRSTVATLTIVFLAVINVCAIVLLRTAATILQPVETLINASRQLAMERFEHRVELERDDEFAELGRAYNRLAEQLQTNEQRKMEVLSQVARTLNHELNSAAAIIDLQLSLLQRRVSGDASFEMHLCQVHDSLHRMTRTVNALKNVRRIVLTDYVQGTKMLDLERSVAIQSLDPVLDENVPRKAELS